MSVTMKTVNAPASGANPILCADATINTVEGDAQAFVLVDPDTASQRVASITANGLKVDGSAVTQPVSGTVTVSNLPATQQVGGSVAITNFPATQPVSGSVSVSNFPATQPVSGTVSVGNFPATYGPGINSTGTGQFVPCADSNAKIDAPAAATTQIIAGVANKSIRVTGYDFLSNGSGTVQFVHGAGNTPLTGPMSVTAQTGSSRGGGYGAMWTLPAGDSLSVITTSTATAQGSVSHTIY